MSTAFDSVASAYDQQWTDAPAGRLQRDAVWRNIIGLVHAGARVLDLGCGTGEDAAWLQAKGARVTAIDASFRMVRLAQSRGIDAECLPIEAMGRIDVVYDGVLSNFGPFNCIDSPEKLRETLASQIRRGGYLAICVMGRFCLWESLAYLLTGRCRKAVRRWRGSAQAESLGIQVTYHTAGRLRRAFAPDFTLERVVGIGIAVPPSFVGNVPEPLMRFAAAADRLIERIPMLRALSDHRLLIFLRK